MYEIMTFLFGLYFVQFPVRIFTVLLLKKITHSNVNTFDKCVYMYLVITLAFEKAFLGSAKELQVVGKIKWVHNLSYIINMVYIHIYMYINTIHTHTVPGVVFRVKRFPRRIVVNLVDGMN